MLSQAKSYITGGYFSLLVCLLVCLLGVSPASAVITFEKWFGGFNWDHGASVVQTTDLGYIVTGWTSSYGAGSYDVYLIKTDSTGDTLWTKTFGGIEDDLGRSVVQTTDGGYIITGYTSSYGAGSYDVYLIKTDSLGDTLWTKTFGGIEDDGGYSVVQTNDGGYIITGYTYSYGAGSYDVYLIKTDSTGDTLWTTTFGGTNVDLGRSVVQTTDEGYIVTGYTYSYGAGSADVYLIKTDSLGNVGVEEKGVESVKHSNLVVTIFSGPLRLPEGKKYKVFDIAGRVVAPTNITRGVYFIEIDGVVTQKVVKVR